eukprot:1301197-Alexandrium_andersonii.AAC.1
MRAGPISSTSTEKCCIGPGGEGDAPSPTDVGPTCGPPPMSLAGRRRSREAFEALRRLLGS